MHIEFCRKTEQKNAPRNKLKESAQLQKEVNCMHFHIIFVLTFVVTISLHNQMGMSHGVQQMSYPCEHLYHVITIILIIYSSAHHDMRMM